MAPLSKQQTKALRMIDEIEKEFGSVWFVQAQLLGITKHTVDALVERRHLKHKIFADVKYYKLYATL